MIRLFFIFLSSVWFALLYLKKAKRYKLKELFPIPKYLPALVIIISSLLFLSFLFSVPQAGDGAYYYHRSTSIIYDLELGRIDAHEPTLLFISLIRFPIERVLGLSMIVGIFAVTLAVGLINCYSTHRLVFAGTRNKSLAIIATILIPFSHFIFWYMWSATYAQFLSISLFFLTFALYFEKKAWWKVSLLFTLASIIHIWTGLLFFMMFTLYIVLAKILKYREMGRAIRIWGAQLLMMIIASYFFGFYKIFLFHYGINFLNVNPLFFAEVFASPALMLFATFGIVSIVSRRDSFNVFLFACILTYSGLIFFTDTISSRLLYAIPVPIFASFGIYRLWDYLKGRIKGKRIMSVAVASIFCVVIVSGVYANNLRVELNLPTISFDTLARIEGLRNQYGYENYKLAIVLDVNNLELIAWSRKMLAIPTEWHVDNFDKWYENYGHLEYDNWGKKIVMVEDRW